MDSICGSVSCLLLPGIGLVYVYRRGKGGSILFGALFLSPLEPFHICHVPGMQGKEIESYLFKRCTESLEQLDAFSIINLSNDGLVSPRRASHVMSRHIVPFSEMSAIIDIPHDAEAR